MSRKRRDRRDDSGQEQFAPAIGVPAEFSGDREARRALFARVRRSVVAIVSAPDQLAQASPGSPLAVASLTVVGTGFIIDGSGTALTAKRVIQPWLDAVALHKAGGGPLPSPPKVTISAPAGEMDAAGHQGGFLLGVVSSIQASSVDDLAAIQFGPPPGHQLVTLDVADLPCHDGDEIVVCGFPMGFKLSQDQSGAPALFPSFSQGIVSAAIPVSDSPATPGAVFQVDANVSGGTSGAPVVDVVTGLVVGIVTEAIARHAGNTSPPRTIAGGSELPTGFAQALHAHRALSVIADLRQTLAG
jgi:S1-C subfamily serine protease